ncbi:Hypothetical predicted protein [Podarcis lilfordi]|uniref:Uncharacterized protein n=1 Tax=Podarcis lilfordi TaxID=74358 RepID=A0AA35NYV2_9SAUR|nr:Hypothetical predicted protein [Podarcis lilfordi]
MMMMMTIPLLVSLPLATHGMQQRAKCPLNLIKDRNLAVNYYQEGDHLISGIISSRLIGSQPPFSFSSTPVSDFQKPACWWENQSSKLQLQKTGKPSSYY